jgi:hypothetical protein
MHDDQKTSSGKNTVINTVYHTVIWVESGTNIQFSLGLEGAIGSEADAEALANAMQEKFKQQYERAGKADRSYEVRVGVLAFPAPDPLLKHPTPKSAYEMNDIIKAVELARHVPGYSNLPD